SIAGAESDALGQFERELPVLARGHVPGRRAGDAHAAFFELSQRPQATLEALRDLGRSGHALGRSHLDHAIRLEKARCCHHTATTQNRHGDQPEPSGGTEQNAAATDQNPAVERLHRLEFCAAMPGYGSAFSRGLILGAGAALLYAAARETIAPARS